jgi:large subunit ribosomal protein L7Ae
MKKEVNKMAKVYVKFDTPEELADQVEEALEVAKRTGKVAKGTNEVTKFIERGDAALVVIAEDVDPEEIVAHIPVLAEEKEIPFAYLATKEKVGGAAGLSVGTASACIVNAGDAEESVNEIVEKVAELKD